MAASQVNIPKLNGTNYPNWSSDMKYVLMERSLWSIVCEEEKLPDGKSEEKEIRDFKNRLNIALSIIYLHVESDYRRIIEGCNDPVEAWKSLKKHFFPDSRAYHMKLFTDLCECRINEGESVDLYGARLLRIADQIQSINANFDEVYFSFQLVRYLPAHFDSVVQSILRWSKEEFKFKNIVNELVAEETRLKLRSNDHENSLNVEIQSVHHNPRPQSKHLICFSCNRPGHISKNCRFQNKYRSPSQSPVRRSTSRNGFHQSRNMSRTFVRNGSPHPNVQKYPRPSNKNFKPTSKKWHGNKNFANFLMEASLSELGGSTEFVFDSAASHHCCRDRALFTEYESLKGEKMAVAMDGVSFDIEGRGTIRVKYGQKFIHFYNVMHASKLRRNLISGPQLDSDGIMFHGGDGEVNVVRDGKVWFRAFLRNGVYLINFKTPNFKNKKVKFSNVEVSVTSKSKNDLTLWHRRCAHVNPSILIKTCNSEGVRGLPKLSNIDFKCEICKICKFRRKSFKPINHIRSKYPLELLYSDVWGPCKTKGRRGERYFLSIIDDFSRKTALYPIKEKTDVSSIVKQHILRAECFLGRKVKSFRSDNGGEFCNDVLNKFFCEKGIRHELTNPYTPEQNGTIERFNQTVTDGARTMLRDSGLEASFWPDAMLHFVYSWNRLVHKDLEKTPFELYGGNRPSVNHLKPFGAVAYAGVPRKLRSKLEAKAKRGFLIGYAFHTRGYRIWLPEENKVIETINVSFDESLSAKNSFESDGAVLGPKNLESDTDIIQLISTHQDSDDDTVDPVPRSSISRGSTAEESESCEDESQCSESESESDIVSPRLRNVKWLRRRTPRIKGDRADIYYYEEGKTSRLRSLEDIRKYCSDKGIVFNPGLFSFKGKDTFEGIVDDSETPNCSFAEGL